MTRSYKDIPPSTWSDSMRVSDDVYYMWMDEESNPYVWHWCVNLNKWLCQGTGNHVVISREPIELSPSLQWTCCSKHGFIRNGTWVPA